VLSLAVHLTAAGFLLNYRPASPPEAAEPLTVELVRRPSSPRAPLRPTKATIQSPKVSETHIVPAGEGPLLSGPPSFAPPAASGQTAAAATPAPFDAARLGAALRNSGIGCANADATRLSDTEREACQRRLAKGAAGAPYIPGVPPEKSAYYAALQENEAEMERNPLGGHGPQLVCSRANRQLGVKLGPCKLTAPLSPWIPEADVRPR
jgi:hypothetical protein